MGYLNLKEMFFVIIFGIIIYLGFSTIIGDMGLIGSFGESFSLFNQLYFGYISYIYILLMLIPLFYLYKDSSFNFRKVEIFVAMFLLFSSSLLAQSMLIENQLRGKLGADFVDFLSPYIGVFGIWIFWFIITFISIIIMIDSSELLSTLKHKKHNSPMIDDNNLNKEIYKTKNINEVQNIENIVIDDEVIPKKEEKNIDKESKKKLKKEEKKAKENKDRIDDIVIKRIKLNDLEPKDDTKIISTPEKIKETTSKVDKSVNNILEIAEKVKEQKNTIVVEELEENTKLLDAIEKGKVEKPKNFILPSVEFLQENDDKSHSIDESELDGKIKYLIEKLAHFKINGDVVRTYAGPVVSTFEFKPAANVKVSKILNLQDDLAMALSAETIRIQAPIPGKDVVGIEIPNDSVDTIYLRELLDSEIFKESSSPLTIALGKDIVGKPFVTDLKKLPHLLIAGTTGSGKSVGINAMILSLLYKNSPEQLRFLMIDPKMLEFSTYNDIPHLLTPVITKPKEAIVALNNMVLEMERRYELMADSRTKNIENYNEKVAKEGGEFFPYIVVIIDELADLMMTSGKDVELSIARLAQKARACGIHLIVATQRPSVDVVTGLIKANLPSRISYRVNSKIDSKIILDQLGAESLLGRGDMLFTPPGATGLVRLHAPWATEDEIENIVEFIKSQKEPNYDKSFLVEETQNIELGERNLDEELDPLFEEAKNVVLTDKKTSISYLQRKLQIGYNRSARVIEQLENNGVLSAPNAKGIREIL